MMHRQTDCSIIAATREQILEIGKSYDADRPMFDLISDLKKTLTKIQKRSAAAATSRQPALFERSANGQPQEKRRFAAHRKNLSIVVLSLSTTFDLLPTVSAQNK